MLNSIALCLQLAVAHTLGGQPVYGSFRDLTSDLGQEVNSPYDESSPSLSVDGTVLIFVSVRPGGMGAWDLYMATRPDPLGPFTEVSNLGEPVNTSGQETSGELSRDRKTLIFVRGNGWPQNLWKATRPDANSSFSEVRELAEVNEGFNAGLPRLSADERILFFTSDRPGGKGDANIWVSTRGGLSEEFEPPMPLESLIPESKVNSTGDEWSATLTDSGLALVFSDSFLQPYRPGGLGGPDIWVSTRPSLDAPFDEPANLNTVSEAAINTQNVEVFPSIARSWPNRGAELFFVTWTGNLDLLRATWEPGPVPVLALTKPESDTITADASGTIAPEGTTLDWFEWDFGDGTASTGETVTHTYARPGCYTVTLKVTNSAGIKSTATEKIVVPCPKEDPRPWLPADVGAPCLPGGARRDGTGLDICAGGRGFAHAGDEFFFSYQETEGDVTLTARISAMIGQANARVGLMLRESLAPDSAFAAVFANNDGKSSRFLDRPSSGARLQTPASGPIVSPPAAWLRIQRKGIHVAAFASSDGTAWTTVKELDLPLALPLLAGIVADGADLGRTPFLALEAQVVDIALDATAPRFRRGDPNSSGATDISDAISVFAFLFFGDPPNLFCKESADANNDAAIDISDGIYLLSWLFTGGPEPAAPGPTGAPCGTDPDAHGTAGDLGCESYTACE